MSVLFVTNNGVPELLTILNLFGGVVVPTPTLPAVVILIASVAPAFPTRNLIKSVVPAPDVDCSERPEPAVVPPYIRGSVIDVVKVGAVPKTAAPEPVSSVSELRRYAEVAVVVARDDESRKRARAAVSELKVI
jgi:hypothetical protein